MKTAWIDLVMPLYCPLIRDNGEKVVVLTLKMITRGQHKAILDDHEGDNWSIYRALIQQGAGLSDSELNKLTGPDFNGLCELADQAYGQSSEYWFEKLIWAHLPKKKRTAHEQAYRSPDSLPLLIPAQTELHGEIDCLPLTLPTVGVMSAMYKTPEDKQESFITQSITGLSEAELDTLSVPDGKSLQLKVSDFLLKTGAYFSALTTSKS